jgi:hypothetical protein
MPLLDLLFSMLWLFLFFAWIWLVITVFIDIFRSDDLSGWAKALWVLFVIFLPLLGVLVYLIARGDGMSQRRMEEAAATRRAQDEYIRNVASSGSSADELAKLADLRDRGVITNEEFASQKAKILGS